MPAESVLVAGLTPRQGNRLEPIRIGCGHKSSKVGGGIERLVVHRILMAFLCLLCLLCLARHDTIPDPAHRIRNLSAQIRSQSDHVQKTMRYELPVIDLIRSIPITHSYLVVSRIWQFAPGTRALLLTVSFLLISFSETHSSSNATCLEFSFYVHTCQYCLIGNLVFVLP